MQNLTARNPGTSGSPASNESLQTAQKAALLSQLWRDLAAAYSHRWDDGGGLKGEKIGIWLEGVSKLTVDQVRKGVLECRKRSDDWPPTLPEFRKLCTGVDRPGAVFDSHKDRSAEMNTARLLAGKIERGCNRIIHRDGVCIWQKKIMGEWRDQPAQDLKLNARWN